MDKNPEWWVEKGLETGLIFISFYLAFRGNWSAANYFLLLAAAIELEEWINK